MTTDDRVWVSFDGTWRATSYGTNIRVEYVNLSFENIRFRPRTPPPPPPPLSRPAFDPYAVLGLPHTASREDTRRQYRQLAKQHHPDMLPPAERAVATRRMAEINHAYDLLMRT